MADAFDDFLSHSSHDNSGGKFLGNWKKRQPPQVDTWMHTAISPKPSWRHQFYKVEVREDKETRESKRVVWSFQFNCHEDEDILKKQYKRDSDGQREKPPCRCPMCRMTEFIYQAVRDGKLSPFETIFRFEGSDDEDAVELHAAGLFGGFPRVRDDFDEEDDGPMTWKAFREAGLSLKEVWKENVQAKLSYVFAVVDNKEPSRGVQIAVETALLGDKVKNVILDRRERLGVEEGSFARNPCAIRWFHKPDEKEFQKKYHATDIALSKVPLTDEIHELITEEASEIVDRVNEQCAPGDVETLRALMERYAVVELPFDKFFEGHKSRKPKDSKAKGDEDDEDDEEEKPAKKPTAKKPAAKKPEPEYECDKCGAPVSEDDETCPKCGAALDDDEDDDDEDDDDPPKPPPAKKPAAKKPAGKKDDEDDDDPPAKKPAAKKDDPKPSGGKKRIPF